MLDFLVRHKKTVIASGVLALVLIIAISVYFIIDGMAKTAKVSIIVAPSIAKVKIGDNNYEAYSEIRLRPGDYAVEISAEGFKTKTGELKAAENETTDIRVYLEPEEGNENYYAENPMEATILGDLKAAETMKKIEELAEKNPILNSLPIEIDYYTKDYAKRVRYTIIYALNDDNTGFTIIIMDYTGGNYEDALEKLTARGFEPKDYTIKYENLTSESEWGYAN